MKLNECPSHTSMHASVVFLLDSRTLQKMPELCYSVLTSSRQEADVVRKHNFGCSCHILFVKSGNLTIIDIILNKIKLIKQNMVHFTNSEKIEIWQSIQKAITTWNFSSNFPIWTIFANRSFDMFIKIHYLKNWEQNALKNFSWRELPGLMIHVRVLVGYHCTMTRQRTSVRGHLGPLTTLL